MSRILFYVPGEARTFGNSDPKNHDQPIRRSNTPSLLGLYCTNQPQTFCSVLPTPKGIAQCGFPSIPHPPLPSPQPSTSATSKKLLIHLRRFSTPVHLLWWFCQPPLAFPRSRIVSRWDCGVGMSKSIKNQVSYQDFSYLHAAKYSTPPLIHHKQMSDLNQMPTNSCSFLPTPKQPSAPAIPKNLCTSTSKTDNLIKYQLFGSHPPQTPSRASQY